MCIVGAGPGGISASLRAIERGLTYVTLEQDELGGTVAKYPRQKLVMTSPVEFPCTASSRSSRSRKEKLLEFWGELSSKAGLKVQTQRAGRTHPAGCRRRLHRRDPEGQLSGPRRDSGRRPPRNAPQAGDSRGGAAQGDVQSARSRGLHRQAILVVGGGDSAVEAAMGLAHQKGNQVTLSYRKASSGGSRTETHGAWRNYQNRPDPDDLQLKSGGNPKGFGHSRRGRGYPEHSRGLRMDLHRWLAPSEFLEQRGW